MHATLGKIMKNRYKSNATIETKMAKRTREKFKTSAGIIAKMGKNREAI
jgi:hypothetical protein